MTSSTALRTVDTVSSCNGPSQGSLESQVGGNHYAKLPIQPAKFVHSLGLGYLEGSAVYYIIRHKDKGGAEDIRKAIHTLELLLELEYPAK